MRVSAVGLVLRTVVTYMSGVHVSSLMDHRPIVFAFDTVRVLFMFPQVVNCDHPDVVVVKCSI